MARLQLGTQILNLFLRIRVRDYLVFSLLLPLAVAHSLGQSGSLSTLYSFCSQTDCTDGEGPWAGLVQAQDGNFYGTTINGGNLGDCSVSGAPVGCGTVFKVTPSGVLTTLHSFSGTDGNGPYSGLTQGGDGSLYGTTLYGGNLDDCSDSGVVPGCGVVFKVTPNGTMTVLHRFTAGTDGANPNTGLIEGSDGNFYGMTSATIYRITSSGTLTTLYKFDSSTGAEFPQSGLVEGSDSNFYGTTAGGGLYGEGVSFRLTASGSFAALDNFRNATDPSGLVEYSDGYFYGTTFEGGATGYGTFFTVAGGEISALYSFSGAAGSGSPESGIFGASDGNFYGTTTSGNGTVFKITPFYSKLTTLYSFAGKTDGGFPVAPVIQGSDGSLYGTNLNDGSSGGGTVYRLALSPSLAAPVQLSLSKSSVSVGSPVTLSWQVLNAFSNTMQQCYAFIQNPSSGAGIWAGKQTGTYSSSTTLFTGAASIKPTAAGTYTYALTCGGQESGFATLTVSALKLSSATTLTASPNPASVGQSVTLKAAVTGSGETPTGTVTFSSEGATLGSAPLNASGVASFTATSVGIPPSTYPVVASYSGDAAYDISASQAVKVTLNKAATSTTLTVNPNPVMSPGPATLTASVNRSSPGSSGFPTGSVTFSAEGITLGSAKLNASGVASLTASSAGISPGSYSVSSAYHGDSSDEASVAIPITVVVK